MKLASDGNGGSVIKWDWLGKLVATMVLVGIPSMLVIGLRLIVRGAIIEERQQVVIKRLDENAADLRDIHEKMAFWRSDRDLDWRSIMERLNALENRNKTIDDIWRASQESRDINRSNHQLLLDVPKKGERP